MVGTTIGKYLVTGQLGRGATGALYKAIDPTLSRDVAMKVLRADVADDETLHRFRTEAAVLARLNHPEIVTIHELVQTGTDLVMVMEFVAGESLEVLARRSGPLAVDAAAHLIDRVLSALEHVHRFGIVHRDLKPANVMVTNVGGVKVMDFGIARVCAGDRITLRGSMMGTPGYMAPEQILGKPADVRADVYAVGAILYRLLAGALPFDGDTAEEVIQRQLSEPLAPLRSHGVDVPETYQTIVARAMARVPDDRFRTADEFREALGRLSGTLKSINLSKRFARDCPAAAALMTRIDPPGISSRAVGPATVRLDRPARGRWATAATAVLTAVVVIAGVLAGRPRGAEISGPDPSAMNAAAPSEPAMKTNAAVGHAAEPLLPPRVLVTAPADISRTSTQSAAASPPMPSTVARSVAAATLSGSTALASASTATPRALRASSSPGPAISKEPSAPLTVPTIPRSEARSPASATASPEAPIAPAAQGSASAVEPPSRGEVTRQPGPEFDAKFLAVGDDKPRELDVRLAVGDRMLSLVARDDSGKLLQTLAYHNVTAISYAVARDPLWKSADGPAPVVRRGGTLRTFGMSGRRHWIVLRTRSDSFVVLRVDEANAPAVLSALGDRTGVQPEHLDDNDHRSKK